jgi:hypothetical protein
MPETPHLDPQHSALLVMDDKPDIPVWLSEAKTLFERLGEAIARQAGVHVADVQVAFDDADCDAIPTTNKAFVRFGDTNG